MGKLTGKKALITGGDSGIGKAVAFAFVREGADVAISFASEDRKDAEATVGQIESKGGKALLVEGDVGDESQAKEVISRTIGDFGAPSMCG